MWNKIVVWFETTGIKLAIDSLDYAVLPLAEEIDKINAKFKDMDSKEKAQWVIAKIQNFLRQKFRVS